MKPLVSVVIPTHNRGESISPTIASILANPGSAFELIIVDQSVNDATRNAVAQFRDARVRYLHTATVGAAQARNLAFALAESEFIAMTDDDCEVPRNWLEEIIAAFSVEARIGIVQGAILAAPHDARAGFVLGYAIHAPFLARGIRDKGRIEGTSANMALRKSLWEKLDHMDTMLGAGAPFKAASDTDVVIRALLAGYLVYVTPQVWVTHHGFRTWDEEPAMIRNYMIGLTTMYVKYLKCGRWNALYPFFQLALRWAFSQPAMTFGRVPSRALRLRAFMEGLRLGWAAPVVRAKCKYVETR